MKPTLHRASVFIAAMLVALAPLRSFAQELTRVPYGVTTSLQHLPILVGKDSGLFAKYGFNIEPVHIRGGALITTMIMSGTVQFSGAGAESVVAARIEGGDVALIACPADTDVVYFVARPEFKNPARLKGKNSAVTRLGSTTHFYLRIALRALPQGIKRVCPGTIEADAARDCSPFPPQLTSHNIAEAAPHVKWCGLLLDQEPSP